MEIELVRMISQPDSTIGALYRIGLKREFLCFTLEDEYRERKLAGETRIPQGRYAITLRQIGGFHQRYSSRFPDIHRGMLHIQDIPNFDLVLIHTGNSPEDTAGCVLLGDTAIPRAGRGQIGGSEVAYRRVYPLVAEHLRRGGEAWLTVTDMA